MCASALRWLVFGLASSLAANAADAWTRRNNDGFGDSNNLGVEWLQTFNGKIYAAVGRDNLNLNPPGNFVSIYQSTDLVSWTRVLGPLSGQTEVFFGTANASAIFFGTKSTTAPGQIWKSTDGTTWTQFNAPGAAGFVAAANILVAALGIFGNDLYAGFNNPNGSQVWRRPVDGSVNWTRVIDFGTGAGLAGGVPVPGISPTYLYASRGVLYLSTVSNTVSSSNTGPQLAFLYQSTDGVTWTRNPAVGNGFGDPNNLNIACLVEFGDSLYASTHNRVTGGQIWSTPATSAAAGSASPWHQVVGTLATLQGGFGRNANNPDNQEVHHLDVGLGYLWATTLSAFSTGAQVWRSSDGGSWTQSNDNGFTGGNLINRGFPTVEIFNGQVVWGGTGGTAFGPSPAGTVAQVWSLAASGIDLGNVPPSITTQPKSQTVAVGGTATFTVVASGSTPLSISWWKNGSPISGATAASLTLTNVQFSDAADYRAIVANPWGLLASDAATLTVTAAPPPPPPPPPPGPAARLANLSVRTAMAAGQTLIVGVVVDGGSRNVLVRAAGPALAGFGLSTAMADPRLDLFRDGTVIFSNEDWPLPLATTFSSVGAFAFVAGSKDAALALSLNGAYSVQCRGTGAGVVLVETYDIGAADSARLVNVSARNRVGTGDDILIAGFNISGTGPKQLLIRAIGPKLTAFGVTGTLTDPKLEVYDGNSVKVTENDNWSASLASTFAAVAAFPLETGSRDAALLTTLLPGTYSVQIRGADGGTGEALVEIYEVP